MSNYSFKLSELSIVTSETVAFINVEGVHNVNGVDSTLTGDPFLITLLKFFLPEVEGTATGVLMGEITFDQPGTYQYNCSVRFHTKEWLEQ